ncbi:MAG: CARDB domain-containing protein, partial [Candidatus Bathyarchaeia archaeon]
MFWRKRKDFGRILVTASLAVFIYFSLYAARTNGLEYEVDSVELTVHRDGSVHVTQILTVDETFPSVSFPSLASEVANVLVIDENQTLLKYKIEGSRFTVFSLGAKKAVIEYDSISLTEKKAGVWSLILQNPYNLTVCLAQGSAITYLSNLPTQIETDDGKIILSLFPGDWEISYLLRIPVPAAFIVSDLIVTPTEVEVGDQVTVSVKVTNVGEAEGSHEVPLEIDGVVEETKIVVLAGRESYTMEFKVVKEDPGIHSIKVGELISEFKVTNPPQASIPAVYLIVICVTIFAFGTGGFVL